MRLPESSRALESHSQPYSADNDVLAVLPPRVFAHTGKSQPSWFSCVFFLPLLTLCMLATNSRIYNILQHGATLSKYTELAFQVLWSWQLLLFKAIFTVLLTLKLH